MSVKVLLTYDASDDQLAHIGAVSEQLIVEKAVTIEEAIFRVADIEVILAGEWSDEIWKTAPSLRWVQSIGAGIEGFLTPEFVASPIMLTNAQGVYADPIGDHMMAMILHFSRGFNYLFRHQLARLWKYPEVEELADRTLGIIGLGGIGSEIARRAKGFKMRVIAIRRRPELPSNFADEVRGVDELPWLLKESDYIAICAPLTQRTQHLIGEAELKLMKPTAYIMNISRGGLIDEAALIAALREKRIAGAGLDVFETEPLPDNSPLWDMPNVLVSPHLSGISPHNDEWRLKLFCENLRRYLVGEPLLNVVDKQEGY